MAGRSANVVIAGGGVAAVEALLALRALAGDDLRIDLVSASRELVYRPLAVGEPFGIARAVDFDLAAIADGNDASLRGETIASVDADRRVLLTREGSEVHYDFLVLGLGAQPREGLPGAVHFGGPGEVGEIGEVLSEIETGAVRRLAFALPAGPSWPLPLYELALLTEAWLEERGIRRAVELAIVTAEDAPLGVFGVAASERVAALLGERGIELHLGAYPTTIREGEIKLVPRGELAADRVIALPAAFGPMLDGLPCDEHGFIPIDDHCRVRGVDHAYAAGDATDFPIKQGGLATQQADAAAEQIAAATGAAVEPAPFDPVLRGVLVTGEEPEFLRGALAGGRGERADASAAPLWWPPGKIAGRYIGPYLAALAPDELRPPGG